MEPAIVVDSNISSAAPLFKKRGGKASTIRKRAATPPPDDSDASSGYTSTEDEGRRIKRRKKTGIVTASSAKTTVSTGHAGPIDTSTTKYAADRSTQITDTNDATKHSNWYEEKNAKALLGSTRPRSENASTAIATTTNNDNSDTTYKGQSAYKSYITQNPDTLSSSSTSKKSIGPIKAPTNVRTITVTDFAPDVCKDYKNSGHCGFGDSCKFLHAREDYKQGWQLDRDWEKAGKNKSANKTGTANKNGNGTTTMTEDMSSSEEEEAALEKIPFACVICKESYKSPIVTKCGHYFCETCALKRYKRNPSCAICGAGTNGVFNGAKNLKKMLDRKSERARRKREKAIADGEEVDEGEGDDGGGVVTK